MRPKTPDAQQQEELFKIRLDSLVNSQHPLVRVSKQLDWVSFDESLGVQYADNGRPGIPTRLMVGLHYLKFSFNLSDEEVVSQWVENPYWQYFCGMEFFSHELPIDPSSMTRWRKRLGESGAEELLRATITTAVKTGVVNNKEFSAVNVDTTVQEKAITFPTDSKLFYRMRAKLVQLARENNIELRQTYVRVGRYALIQSSRYFHARQARRGQREVRKLRTYLGRVTRDIERKVKNNPDRKASFSESLALAKQLLSQNKNSKDKIYSLHAPEVCCIAKGKAYKKYEFGSKVSVLATQKSGLILACNAHTNTYDGHLLPEIILQAESLIGKELVANVFTDKGFRGHSYEGSSTVYHSGRKLQGKLRKMLRRRSAIEPLIGHMKSDSRLGRNYLLGFLGDKLNAIFSAAAMNLRLLIAAAYFCLFFLKQFYRSNRQNQNIPTGYLLA